MQEHNDHLHCGHTNSSALWLLLTMLVCMVFGAITSVVAINVLDSRTTPYNPYQPKAEIDGQYKRCKANAPEGMDCVTVFMLVSNDFIKEEFSK